MRFSALLVLTILYPATLLAQVADFDAWKQALRTEAATRGVPETLFDTALANTVSLPDVIALDRKQPEKTRSFEQYFASSVNARRIARGKEFYREHKVLLDQISTQYGVQAPYIVALWGMETDYGDNTGGFSIVDSLATLAYDGRRSTFFREELIQALLILRDAPVALNEFEGSWAGAMGQCQFMPSSYHRFAVDYDRDGRKDIWYSQPDVFASIANYLASSGWDGQASWGREVSFAGSPESFLDRKMTYREWAALGFSGIAQSLPNSETVVTLITPDKQGGRYFLVTGNYDVILKWNRSRYFATSVGMLADAITE